MRPRSECSNVLGVAAAEASTVAAVASNYRFEAEENRLDDEFAPIHVPRSLSVDDIKWLPLSRNRFKRNNIQNIQNRTRKKSQESTKTAERSDFLRKAILNALGPDADVDHLWTQLGLLPEDTLKREDILKLILVTGIDFTVETVLRDLHFTRSRLVDLNEFRCWLFPEATSPLPMPVRLLRIFKNEFDSYYWTRRRILSKTYPQDANGISKAAKATSNVETHQFTHVASKGLLINTRRRRTNFNTRNDIPAKDIKEQASMNATIAKGSFIFSSVRDMVRRASIFRRRSSRTQDQGPYHRKRIYTL